LFISTATPKETRTTLTKGRVKKNGENKMGNDQSMTRQQLKEWEMKAEGRLSRKDIKKYRKIWLEMFGDKEMDKEGFRKWIRAIGIFPNLPDDAPVDHLFRSYDRDRSGTISFEEFILYLSITAPTQKEQDPAKIIEVTFLLYDADGDGYLTEEELIQGMKDTFKLLGHNTETEKFKKIIKTRVQQLVELADANGDGQITLAEIQEAVKKNPKLLLIF
jgi:Ca2+-binding EF-hand superfamily protein